MNKSFQITKLKIRFHFSRSFQTLGRCSSSVQAVQTGYNPSVSIRHLFEAFFKTL